MAGIRVTPEQLQAMSARVNSGASHIEGEVAALAAALSPLGGDWAGIAQQRFESLWTDCQAAVHRAGEDLTGIAQLLSQAGVHYSEAETAIAASFGAM